MTDDNQYAIIYGRASRDFRKKNQDGSSVNANELQMSLDKQESVCISYYESKGMIFDRAFVDSNVSGSTCFEERKGGSLCWQYLCENADKKNLNLIVFCPDRFGRRASDILRKFEDLVDIRVNLHLADTGVVGKDDSSWLLMAIRSIMAQFELITISKRYRQTMDHKIRNGERVCRSVFGFDFVETDKVNSSTGNRIRTLVENLEEQKWIRFAKEMRDNAASFNTIRMKFNELGVRTKGGTTGNWTKGMIHSILNNRHTLEKVLNTANGEQ